MKETKLGQVPPDDAERDAVHIAVLPVVAGEGLIPGQRVVLRGGQAFSSENSPIGVVDPFGAGVKVGQRFYLCLLPGTITSLRHKWTHPDIPEQTVKTSASREWIENFLDGRAVYASHHPKLKIPCERPDDCARYGKEYGWGCMYTGPVPYDYFIKRCEVDGQFIFNTDYHGEQDETLKFHLEAVIGHPLGEFYAGCSC